MPFLPTRVDPEDIRLSEICQTENDRYHITSLLYVESENNQKNKQTSKSRIRPSNTENKLKVAGGVGQREEWNKGN